MQSHVDSGNTQKPTHQLTPLAERMRPQALCDFVGQTHILGNDKLLRRLIERDKLTSSIFWGAPGCGKTTLARIIARQSGARLIEVSAVSSGVREIRSIIEQAVSDKHAGNRTILFIDEIHRFNKAQQDALLHAVEDGTIILIGATTENPSFEVISPLLSRCRVFTFKPLIDDDISLVIEKALKEDAYLKKLGISINDNAKDALVKYSGGDARTAFNALEVAVELGASDQNDFNGIIEVSLVERALMVRQGRYDKKGDYHFDVISAFIKSLRGSDPDGAIYWLARMINAGEDPLFIARRMVILASEDIGNCNPTALVLAQSCAEAVKFVGMPEAQLILAQTVLYLASSPKSNSTLTALLTALDDIKKDPDRPVPLHLRNAVTGLMKAQDYGKNYKYAHDHDGNFAKQQHLPDELKDRVYYHPSEHGVEKAITERLKVWWPNRKRGK